MGYQAILVSMSTIIDVIQPFLPLKLSSIKAQPLKFPKHYFRVGFNSISASCWTHFQGLIRPKIFDTEDDWGEN